ncbi:MAG: hypothetical protein JWN44_5171 [Myxococcales bacterium]|nr:hypothetical protein [Myxococcales bacterium]
MRVENGAVTESSVSFTIEGGFAQASEVSMTVAKPILKLHTTDKYAEIDAVTLPLGDVTISAEALPPRGLILRNLVVKTGAAHATVMHAQADALELRAKLPLSLDWAVQLDDGSLYQLGTVKTAPLNVDVQIVRGADGKSIATVQAACLGTCWAVDGVAKLSDGNVYLQTDAELTWSK